MKYRRIDRFIEFAISKFAQEIIRNSKWKGKERDCVNLFAARCVLPAVSATSAITDYSQVRIECGVPQPKSKRYKKLAAPKDFVVWRGPLDVAWNADWEPTNIPWVVVEWKTRRNGDFSTLFDPHDKRWLMAFSRQNPKSFGYAVTVDFSKGQRQVHLAKFRQGRMKVRRNLCGG